MNFYNRSVLPELTPGRIPELDEQIRATLAALIMDESVELPPSHRGNKTSYSNLSNDQFIELYKPLVEVLELNPSIDPPPFRESFNRASKLGLTPSVGPIYSRMDLSRVHTGLGFRAKFRFHDWSLKDYVAAGQRLARHSGGRPTREIITRAGRGEITQQGPFPTVDNIKARFGKLSVFHELIGYPSCKGWEEEDYLDWAAAFYRQNPGEALTARKLDYLSSLGRGPSKIPILKIFGSINKFKARSLQEYDILLAQIQETKDQRLKDALYLSQIDEDFLQVLKVSSPEPTRILQVTAQYQIAKRLVTTATPADIINGSQLKSPDAYVRWCITKSNNQTSAADIESLASALGLFDDLWPMYRFENVNLKL